MVGQISDTFLSWMLYAQCYVILYHSSYVTEKEAEASEDSQTPEGPKHHDGNKKDPEEEVKKVLVYNLKLLFIYSNNQPALEKLLYAPLR